jgi:UDP-N-acetylmuramyl pentapeptide phosphotransferase/UDP-N-acetylglucosamine-1-phosphate transferase
MKKFLLNPIVAAIIVACSVSLISGCVTPNPDWPTVPNAPAYLPDTAGISNTVAAVTGAINATSPINPYAAPLNGVAVGVGGIAAALSSLVALWKSRRKQTELDRMLTAATSAIETSTDTTLKPKVKALSTVAGVESQLYQRLNG